MSPFYIAALIYPSYIYGQGVGPVVASEIYCKGNEKNLTECSIVPSDVFSYHYYDVGIKCFNETCKPIKIVLTVIIINLSVGRGLQ